MAQTKSEHHSEPLNPIGRRLSRQRFDAALALAQAALKTAVLINGAGTIALLALFAQSFKDGGIPPGAAQFAQATLWMVAGTALAGGATGLSFLAQYGDLLRWQSWFGRGGRALALTRLNIALIFLSYACFVIGGLHAYWALSGAARSAVFAAVPAGVHQLLQAGAALGGLIAAVLWFLAAKANMESSGTRPGPVGIEPPPAGDAALEPGAAPDGEAAAGPIPDFSGSVPRPGRKRSSAWWSAWAAAATGIAALLQGLSLMP
jgi:hypothetical protein